MSEFSIQIGQKSAFVGKFPDLDANLRHAGTLGHDLSVARGHAFAAAETFTKAREELERDGKWSAEGRAARLKEVGAAVLGKLKDQVERALVGADQVLQDRFSTFGAVVPRDPSDLAGQLADQEARAFLRSQPETERLKVARQSPAMRDAALRAPAALSGLHPEVFELLRKDGAAALHGDRIRQAEELADALGHVQRVYSAVREQIAAAAGVTPPKEK